MNQKSIPSAHRRHGPIDSRAMLQASDAFGYASCKSREVNEHSKYSIQITIHSLEGDNKGSVY